MKNRITEIRKAEKLNMDKFGKRLGVSAAAISRIESGERSITDQMVKSICREFNINESWLRTGEGEMLNLPEDEDAAIVAEILGNSDNEFYQEILKLVKAFSECDPKEQDAIISLIKRYKKL